MLKEDKVLLDEFEKVKSEIIKTEMKEHELAVKKMEIFHKNPILFYNQDLTIIENALASLYNLNGHYEGLADVKENLTNLIGEIENIIFDLSDEVPVNTVEEVEVESD